MGKKGRGCQKYYNSVELNTNYHMAVMKLYGTASEIVSLILKLRFSQLLLKKVTNPSLSSWMEERKPKEPKQAGKNRHAQWQLENVPSADKLEERKNLM